MNNKISTNEIMVICICLSAAMFPGFANLLLLKTGRSTTIIACLLGLLIGLIPILTIIVISKHLENKNIFEFNKEKLKIIGILINIIFIIIAIIISAINSWNICDFIISQFLTRNSYYALALVLCSIIAIAVIKGIESIGRSTLILMFFFTIIAIIATGLLIPNTEMNNLLPLFNISKANFIKTTLIYATYISLPFTFILGIKKNKIVDNQKYTKKVLIAYLLSGIITIGIFFFIIATFGDAATIFTYPEHTLFKNIRFFDFIERIENIVSITIFITYFGNFAFLLYFIKEGIFNTINIKQKNAQNIITYLLAIMIPIISIYLFKEYNLLIILEKLPLIITILFPLLIIILITSKTTKKKQKTP